MNRNEIYTLGIDIGSNTVKIAILDSANEVLFSSAIFGKEESDTFSVTKENMCLAFFKSQ